MGANHGFSKIVVVVVTLCFLIPLRGYPYNGVLRDEIIETAESFVGVREMTGNNDGVEIEMFLASVGLGSGFAWCAAFVHYIFKDCGIDNRITAWSPTCCPGSKIVWSVDGKKNGTPQPADVFGIYYRTKKRIGHTGFVKHWGSGDYVTTIEGNTNGDGSREGDGVYIRRRNKRTLYVVADHISN